MYVNISGLWKSVKKIYINKDGLWKAVLKGYVNVSGIWKLFFSGEDAPQIESQVTIAQSSPNPSNALITLTGRNFHWTNALSLTYYFEWSVDGGSNWTTLSTGNINNPASGTFNEVTHIVTSVQASPNIDNLYRFRVFAINVTLTNSSTSGNTTISTPRNITWATPAITNILYNSATLNFTSGGYANSYSVRIVNTSNSTTSYQTISASPGTITGLSSSSNYTVYLTGYTGSSANGYAGNESTGQSFTTPAAPEPTQTIAPEAPAGNGLAFTPMAAGNSGSYNNSTGSPVTVLIKLISTSTPTNGSTTPEGAALQPLYEVTQPDATAPVQNFYTRDEVTALNGTKYYYYSTAVPAFVGTVTDNFNRTVPSGLGTSSSFYIYSSYSNLTSSWSTNGSVANNSTAVSFNATATQYPMQTIEVGNPNRTYSIKSPNGSSGGVGVAYWVTGAGSWYATIPYYTYATSTTRTCNPPVTITSYTCNPPVTTTTYTCNPFETITTYGCGGSATTSFCPDNFTFEYNANTVGRRCSSCSTTTSYSYNCGNDVSVPSDPGTVVACNQPSHNGQPCSKFFVGEGFGWIVSYCNVSSSTSYSYSVVNSSTSSGCIGNTYYTNASGSGCGGCPVTPSTVTTCSGSTISTNASGSGCGGCPVTASSSTTCSGSTINTDASGTGCGGCPVSTATSTTYYTFLDIVASGNVVKTQQLTSNTFSGFYSSAGYSRLYSHSTIVNNNTVTARGYNSSGVQIGSDVVYSASNPVRFDAVGGTSAGVIKGHTNDLNGNTYDDLSM